MASKKMDIFDGEGDIKEFVTRIQLYGIMKGYTGEKLSYCLAEKLRGPAFSVFLRMSEDDRKDFEKLKKELYKEFKSEERNREEAVSELSKRKRLVGESIPTFAYRVAELVQFSYPSFDDAHRGTVAKDYFVNGLSENMQVWLKASPDFASKSMKDVTELAASFEIAGVKSNIKSEIFKVNDDKSLVDEIADAVIEKLSSSSSSSQGKSVKMVLDQISSPENNPGNGINYFSKGASFRSQYNRQSKRYNFDNKRNSSSKVYKCRCCQSTEHLFRSCPTRCCQACGARGHDAWDKKCPNYEL